MARRALCAPFLATPNAPHLDLLEHSFPVGADGPSSTRYTEFDRDRSVRRSSSFSFSGLEVARIHPGRGRVTLVEDSGTVPSETNLGADTLLALRAGGTIAWKLAE